MGARSFQTLMGCHLLRHGVTMKGAVSANTPPLAAKDVDVLLNAAKALPAEYVGILKNQAIAIPELLEDIERAAQDGNAKGAENAAHKLKNNSATFGARALWAQAQEAEHMAAAGDLSAIGKLAPEMRAEYDAAKPVIERLLGDMERTVS